MADQFDQAQETEALHLSAALAAQAKRSAPVVLATGECLNPLCREPLEDRLDKDGKAVRPLFCDAKCAAVHAKRSK